MESVPQAEGVAAPSVVARTVAVAAALFCTSAAFILAKTGRDALYFMNDGVYDLPMAYLGIAVLSVPMSFVMFGLMKWCGARVARVTITLATVLFLVSIAWVVRPGGGMRMTAIFMWIPLLFGVLFSAAWLLAADLLEHATVAQRAQAYGWIGAAAILGGVVAGLVAKVIAMEVRTSLFFILAAGTLLVAAGIMASAHYSCPRGSIDRVGVMVMPQGSDTKVLLRMRYAYLLLAIAMLTSLAGLLIEFQFYLAAATSAQSMRANAQFFATFYLVLNTVALVVQVFLIPRFQQRFGVFGCLFVLPVILFGGVTALLATGSGFTQSLLRVAEGSLKSSVHRVSWEQAYLPLQRTQRGIVKLFVDGLGARLAEGTGAVIILFWLRAVVAGHPLKGQSTAWLGWLLFAVVALWIALTTRLGRRVSEVDPEFDRDSAGQHLPPIPDSCVDVVVRREGAV